MIWEDGQTVTQTTNPFEVFVIESGVISWNPCFHLRASGSTLGKPAVIYYPPSACQTSDSWSTGRILVK